MALRLGDVAPDFTADTTEGEISFHQWKDGSWAVLFSHPADFTPVCTTELGRTAELNDAFTARNVKTIAVSVDPLESHKGWAGDIGDVGGTDLNFPIIADPDNQPVFFHCHHGINRTSMTQIAYRTLHCGWTLDQAKEEITRMTGWKETSVGTGLEFMERFYETRVLPRRESAERGLSSSEAAIRR